MLYRDKKILVIGLGMSGVAAARFLLRRGAHVWGVDRNSDLLKSSGELAELRARGVHTLHESESLDLKSFDAVVVSPGVPPASPFYAQATKLGLEIIGEVELACRGLTQPCVAITGSNGKTTTTLLVEHVLNHAGYPARALGNVGIPLTAALEDPEGVPSREIIVLELSSWQLETLSAPVIDAGVVLNITPNHLDRHGTMENYASAKLNLKNVLKPGKPLYLGLSCYKDFGHLLGQFPVKTFGYHSECSFSCDRNDIFVEGKVAFQLPLDHRGKVSHEVENMLAAYALCHAMGVTGEQFLAAYQIFKKPPHRIQFVAKFGGVSYYDDSKGTNLDAVVKAVQAMDGPTYLIAGGVHKGAAYTPWIKAFGGKVRGVCAIGQAAQQLKEDLGEAIPVEIFASLREAVAYASAKAKSGENVLLSPGCASYDMFKDYNHRGEEFQRIVTEGNQL